MDEAPDSPGGEYESSVFLPIANVSRIMKKVLPFNAKISNDAKETVQMCVTDFIFFITTEAVLMCKREKRSEITGNDVVSSIATLGFNDYYIPLNMYLTRYREENPKAAIKDREDHAMIDDSGVLPGFYANAYNQLGDTPAGAVFLSKATITTLDPSSWISIMDEADDAPHCNEESSPLLGNGRPEGGEEEVKQKEKAVAAAVGNAKIQPPPYSDAVKGTPAPHSGRIGYAWAAYGLPVGEPVGRDQWNSSLFACLGHNDEFCGSDIEVCLLGTVAPCVLYGSNVERLGTSSGTFANHCMAYCGVYLFGSSFFGCNLLPYFSYHTRTAIRHRFHLEGNFEALHRSCGCFGSIVEDGAQLNKCETGCDLLTHVLCHTCALCQEGREVRRRLPRPGFCGQRISVMVPPVEQAMGREA
ncbi:hypothetical protein SAY86_005242 [Trapa natans]|uniref:Transcription factor CBF/NF-Y/archaeal histone domain-containing protein n=1 Tax=Trapa natans TaxID=22666 RepID=A0AAN7QR92_TRANT|nr:hypothetical protein SAY86_005242 [Trapa natans]